MALEGRSRRPRSLGNALSRRRSQFTQGTADQSRRSGRLGHRSYSTLYVACFRNRQRAAGTRRVHQVEHARARADTIDTNITGLHLIDELDRLALDRGYPAVLRCDNGPELACAAIADRAGERTGLHFIPPGQPWRNGYIESFNSRVRDECLNINMFWSLAQARVVISDWKADYNHRRRHSALGHQAPAVYAAARTHP
jgi:putative transposase